VRAARRGALLAALRLVLVVGGLLAFALWWRREKEPDWRVDQRLRLAPVRVAQEAPSVNLGGETRDALALRCGQSLRYEFHVPGRDAVLRFADGHVTAHPELAVRLVLPGGETRELEHHETSESAWTVRRVELPVAAAEDVTLELAALDGRGRPGLGEVYVADVVLESAGRGVDQTESQIELRAIERDLLASHEQRRSLAPPTRESGRIGVEGPPAVALETDQLLHADAGTLPPDARLEVVLHVGRKRDDGPTGQVTVEVLVDDSPLAVLAADLETPAGGAPPESREVSASLDLGPWAGKAPDVALRRSGAPNLWVGLRELDLSVPRRVPRRPFVAGHGRNVLLVVIDALRADRLGCSGWPAAATPVIDSLAARGGLWTRVLSPSSWALPDLASLLTGVSPLSHGLGVWPRVQLSPRLPTLAQSAAWSGYTTACFSGSSISGPAHGLQRGFERCDVSHLPADAVAGRALDWLEEASQFEWFLMLHLADPSFPHEPAPRDLLALPGPPPAELVTRLRALDSRPGAAEAVAFEVGSRYDAELAGVDRALGRITDWLAARDLLRSTLVVVVGSSGEEFYDHGGRLHGQTLWDEVVVVPLVMAGPAVRGPDGGPFVEHEPISLLDVTRMLGEYGHLSTRSGQQGRLPPPFGPRLPEPVFHSLLRPVLPVTASDLDASRSRRWLRLFDHARGVESLYDLLADPLATRDLLADPGLEDDARQEAQHQADALGTSFADWVRASLLASAAQAEPVQAGRP
jgi:hypothetical protein